MVGTRKYIRDQGCGPYKITDKELWKVYFAWKKWADKVLIIPVSLTFFDVVAYRKVNR